MIAEARRSGSVSERFAKRAMTRLDAMRQPFVVAIIAAPRLTLFQPTCRVDMQCEFVARTAHGIDSSNVISRRPILRAVCVAHLRIHAREPREMCFPARRFGKTRAPSR